MNYYPTSAHRLFPADQAILWLPGLPGDREAFCTYNRASSCRFGGLFESPPFPVSPVTFIAWDTSKGPAFPFHPVPVARRLSKAQLKQIARRVIHLAGEDPANYTQPLRILRNDRKRLILAAIGQIGFRSGYIPPAVNEFAPELAAAV